MSHSEVASLSEGRKWVRKPCAYKFVMVCCAKGERVCHVAKAGEDDFIYMYETVLADLGVVLPFEFFEADVLRMLGIAPSQLHPNGWAAIQAFKVVCLALGVMPSASVFLSHYTMRVSKKVGWVSLAPLPNTSLFSTYTTSYKGFKSRFVKIKAVGGGRFCADPRSLALYWREPLKFKGLLRSQLSLEVRVDLQLLDELPQGMNCKEIVAWVSERNATYHMKSMLKKQGIDMEELIRKAKLINKARSTPDTAKVVVNVEMVATPTKAKGISTNAKTEKMLAPTKAGKVLALADGKGQPASTDLNATKRKAKAFTIEEASRKKGKATTPPPPLPLQPKAKVIVTSVPGLPLGGLSCYVAPLMTHSLWG
ncbi:hypothetical protein CR513_16657, partial [Mucuna pruriens]